MQAERLLRAAEAPPCLGVGNVDVHPRAAKLGRPSRIPRTQHARTFHLQHLDARTPLRRQRLVARVGEIGGLVSPALFGFAAEHMGYTVSFAMIGLCSLATAMLLAFSVRETVTK